MKLKYNQICYKEIDYCDWDDFVNACIPEFNGEYECVPYEEWNNDSSHEVHVDSEMSKWDVKDMEKMILTGKPSHYSLYIISSYLCNKRLLDEGNYLIKVSW